MKYFYAFLFLLLLGLWPPAARAADAGGTLPIYLSEINWAGGTLSRADEWIELYNPNGESVDLSGWILTGSATNSEALMIADGTIIEAESPLLIANYGLDATNTTLTVEPDLVTTAMSLSNSAFEILLATPDGEVIDEATLVAGSSDPIVSQTRNLSTLEWEDTTVSVNLSDPAQLGTPRWVPPLAETQTDTNTGDTETDPLDEPDETSDETNTNANDETVNDTNQPSDEVVDTTDETDEAGDASTDNDNNQDTQTETQDDTDIDTDVDQTNEGSDSLDNEIPSYAPGDILVNELVSDPEDGTEWIEFLSTRQDVIDLTGFTVLDRASHVTVLSGTIAPQGFLVLYHPVGALNNDGDDVVLKDPNGQIIDQMSYDDDPPGKGESYARAEDETWATTPFKTPGSKNIFVEDQTDETLGDVQDTGNDPDEDTTINEEGNEQDTDEDVGEDDTIGQEKSIPNEHASDTAKEKVEEHRVIAIARTLEQKEEGQSTTKTKTENVVTLSGTLTALPGTFGKQVAFMQGVELYFYRADWPELDIGDVLSVTGTPSENRGEKRLKIESAEDIVVVGHEDLVPTEVAIADLSVEDEGNLVRISGSMLTREGTKMTLSDESGDITVVAQGSTTIHWAEYAGTEFSIIGVVRVVSDEVRLYPRSKDDVQTMSSNTKDDDNGSFPVASAKKTTPIIGATLLTATVGACSFWFVKFMKKKNLERLDTKLSTQQTQMI